MIQIIGPDNDEKLQYLFRDYPKLYDGQGFHIDADNVMDAIRAYSAEYGVEVYPYDGSIEEIGFFDPPKYFFYHSKKRQTVVDIHIVKPDGSFVCIKQDLDYPLEVDDILVFGELEC
ncbi:hypothetical protein AUP74_02319 [Microbulbifer aggregans]|uniref:Uncharacterized protein n=1 Tax=Microbulbifer aggregans TaxID=1769779 RepID=A0A1C9W984_9GAMM|nr:hypothetical protein [Microbulbifer aggregans]AOS97727.1 hypothetical protein AUP74_02319 [Microbulbifer aggregans]